MMSSKSRYLITTADERTWKFNEPVLFLGDWCCRYDRKKIWQLMDAIVCKPYGLELGEKERNYAYVKKITEELLIDLSNILNEYHGTNHKIRYWRILLGHWLFRYVSVIFNRYFTLEHCLNQYKISGTTVFSRTHYHLATPDSDTFV